MTAQTGDDTRTVPQSIQDAQAATRKRTVLAVMAFLGIALASYIIASTGVVLPFPKTRFLAYVLTWLLLAVACAVTLDLLRRHHRTIARHAARHGKRGAVAGFGAGRHHGGRLLAHLEAKARTRWAARRDASDNRGDPAAAIPSPHDPGTAPADPAATDTTPGEAMTQPARGPSRITPARRARGAAARTGGAMPAAWQAVIARTADFEPENDGEFLDWMAGEVAGVAGYAEALVDLYEGLTQGTGLDPVGVAALHDVADAQAHASEIQSGARKKFADHYDRPREFAAEGGLMPHDGRWVTGEGDA